MTGIKDWQSEVTSKLDRLMNDVQFIKNRTAIYLGRSEVLTYLIDETPIFVNSDDFGCPINFINGGLYEEDNFHVFLSFRDPKQPMLDIGANLGYYSIRMGAYLRRSSIQAFEPIPRIRGLFSRSAFLNGYSGLITINPFAVSDKDGNARLSVPRDHAGGASLMGTGQGAESIEVEVKKLDDFYGPNFSCGLVKIDVEGHELSVLRGMRKILSRSKRCAVMFEKLQRNSGIEDGIIEIFKEIDWAIYRIAGRKLDRIEVDGFRESDGYYIAARPDYVAEGGSDRNFFDVMPIDLNVIHGRCLDDYIAVECDGRSGEVLVHGPYWFLARGYYRVAFDCDVDQEVGVEVCERFGYRVVGFQLSPSKKTFDFAVQSNLMYFEFVFRASSQSKVAMNIRRIRVQQIG